MSLATLLKKEHRWLFIGSLLDNLMTRLAKEVPVIEDRKNYDMVDMVIPEIDRALTEEFKQIPLTESEIVDLIQGIDIIVAIAELKVARIQEQQQQQQYERRGQQ